MPVRELGDPRLQELFGVGEARDIGVRPMVRLPRRGTPGWAIAAGAVVAAILLFWLLESRRQAPAQPSVRARAVDAPAFAPEPPPLYIPPAPAPAPAAPVTSPADAPQSGLRVLSEPQSAPAPVPVPPAVYFPEGAAAVPQPLPQPPRTASGSALVIDTTAPGAPTGAPEAGANASPVPGLQAGQMGVARRARASALANRSTTVAQGTVIPAVLETAFDSTRPGFARAIVSRDVRGFDGTKVLVPRGSRLVGEYRSDVSPGQKRATISWTRLIRPDGMMIAIDSPAVDPLGRGGVRASVNTHFVERFTGALLQSVVNFGQIFASRRATGSVIVTPGSAGQGAVEIQPGGIPPTLKVPAGTSISVFVAHDLDFGGEGNRE